MSLPLPPTQDRELTADERSSVRVRVAELAELRYRAGENGGRIDPLQHVVHEVLTRALSPDTAGETGTKAYSLSHALTQRWGSWDAVRVLADDLLAAELKAAGLPRQRLRRLQSVLNEVHQQCQARSVAGTTLTWLRGQTAEAVTAYLKTLDDLNRDEVTRVAAAVVTPAASDRGLQRVLRRLDLASTADAWPAPPTGRERTAGLDDLETNLLQHSRAVCHRQQPDCGDCPLISFCKTGRANNSGDGRPVGVELFAGGGGMGEGFDRAGFDMALAVELDRDAAQTYRINHPGTVVLEADATAVTGDDLRFLVSRADNVAVIVAGPPCQGYSAAGKRQAADRRNHLYNAVVDLAADLKPRFVVIENVPGMRRVGGESYVEAVLDALASTGYAAKEHLLRACDYGVPQLRRRMLFLAQREDAGSAPNAPEPSHCAGRHCKRCNLARGIRCGLPAATNVLDALDGLPYLDHGQVIEYKPDDSGRPPLTNATTMAHSKRVIEKIASITAGSGPISYRRLHPDVARTIVAGHRALPVHPTLNRTISVREAARIQGFGDDHVFAGPRSKQPLQVANAVPPALAEAVASVLVGLLADRSDRSEETSPATATPCSIRDLDPSQRHTLQPGRLTAAAG